MRCKVCGFPRWWLFRRGRAVHQAIHQLQWQIAHLEAGEDW